MGMLCICIINEGTPYPQVAIVVQLLSLVQQSLMDCSTQASLSFTVSQSWLKFMSIELVMSFNHLILCCSLLLLPSIFPNTSVLSNESTVCVRWTGMGASASVLPMNIQDWSPLGLPGWICLQSKGLSRVFSNITAQKHQFFSTLSLLYGPTLTSIQDYWKNHSFDY